MINRIEVILSPLLFENRIIKNNAIVVVIDVLRATTTMCAAFDEGVSSIIAVKSVEEAREYKVKHYCIAGERDGVKLSFADFGNSAFDFINADVAGKTIVFSSTNGTNAIDVAQKNNYDVALAAFTNLNVLHQWLQKERKDVIVFCAGWKNNFSLEDTLCAGALIEKMCLLENYENVGDSAMMALTLWQNSKHNLKECMFKTEHYKRLLKLNQDDVLHYTISEDMSFSVPLLKINEKEIRNIYEGYERKERNI